MKKEEENQAMKKLQYPGDPIFKLLIQDISLDTFNKKDIPKIAAEYYYLAFRAVKLMHFSKNSCIKKIYFLRSNPWVQEFMNFV